MRDIGVEKIGVIGGSGMYRLFENAEELVVETPFGTVKVYRGKIEGKEVFFLPRHGIGHTIPPHRINYRANAMAMLNLRVRYVISTSAVGSLRRKFKPSSIVVPDQIIDMTKGRPTTLFDGDFEIEMPDGRKKGGVVHTDVTEPYCNELREKIFGAAKALGLKVYKQGTYVCTEGPRFETPAEIKFFRKIGGDLVGMTNAPEAFLFKELEICYATIAIVTNYAAGMQKRVTHEEVLELFNKMRPVVINLIKETIKRL